MPPSTPLPIGYRLGNAIYTDDITSKYRLTNCLDPNRKREAPRFSIFQANNFMQLPKTTFSAVCLSPAILQELKSNIVSLKAREAPHQAPQPRSLINTTLRTSIFPQRRFEQEAPKFTGH
ncbi:hypothetical protein DSO57_1021673 [Entomophthora muscae]|uniref:Uncharacterized protein n=1 Tax=Entomophthora muscae TaxID=34485 RepID=A0ACC2T3J4_9FUNG|nr:hypothetical protein DSO57_1021673 [Entomophthora muscae]